MPELPADAQAWLLLVTLAIPGIVLGIDDTVSQPVPAGRLPARCRHLAGLAGLALPRRSALPLPITRRIGRGGHDG